MKRLILLLLFFGWCSGGVFSQGAPSGFIRKQLQFGVSVEIPDNWWVFDSELNDRIKSKSSPSDEITLLRANSTPLSTYASIAVKAQPSDVNPRDVAQATASEMRVITSEIREGLIKGFARQDMQVQDFRGVRKELLNGHPALVIELKRSGEKGPVVVMLTHIYLSQREVSLNLSYRESEAARWIPVIKQIRQSFRVVQESHPGYKESPNDIKPPIPFSELEAEEPQPSPKKATSGSWGFLIDSVDEKFFLNPASIQTADTGAVSVWIKSEPVRSTRDAYVGRLIDGLRSSGLTFQGYSRYSHKLSRFEIECKRGQYRLLAAVDYDLDGRILNSVEIEEYRAKWHGIIPESIAEQIRLTVCGR
jgi:hypothetical protein